MWVRLLLLATVFLIGSGFSNSAEEHHLVVSGDPEHIHPQLGAYVEEIVPGEERDYAVEVSNPTEHDITALLYMADAIPAFGDGKDFTLPDDPDIGSAAWFTTADRSITVRAGETQRFTVKLRIPHSVQPGQYVSVIGIYEGMNRLTNMPDDVQVGDATPISYQTGVKVILNYKLEEAKPPQAVPHSVSYVLENGEAFLSMLVMNEGDSLSKPEMMIRVKQQDAEEFIVELNTRIDSIYAGTVAQYWAELSQPLTPGNYLAEIMTTVNGKTEKKVLSFEVGNDEERASRDTLSSGEVLQVVEDDDSPLPDSLLGVYRRYFYIGLLLLLVIVTWRRKRIEKQQSKES